MQDGDSTKERTKRNGIQFTSTFNARHTEARIYRQQQLCTYTVKARTKARTKRRATTEYICYTGTLTQFYLIDWRHTHTFTQNPKETKVATSLACTEFFSAPLAPSSSGVVGELVPRATRVGRSTPRTGFWGTNGGFQRYLGADGGGDHRYSGSRERENGGPAGSHQRGLGTTPTPANPRTGTLEQELSLSLSPHRRLYKRSKAHQDKGLRPELSSSALFVARGSAPSLRPVLCSTSLRGISRKVSTGGVPPP